jgi:hypothetical protein
MRSEKLSLVRSLEKAALLYTPNQGRREAERVEFRLPQTHATKQKALDLGWNEKRKEYIGKAACASCHGPEAL